MDAINGPYANLEVNQMLQAWEILQTQVDGPYSIVTAPIDWFHTWTIVGKAALKNFMK